MNSKLMVCLSGRFFNKIVLLLILLGALFINPFNTAKAQCTDAKIKWDYLDYLSRNIGDYSTYVTTTMERTQKFALAQNMLTIEGLSNITFGGEVTTHTGEAGSYGTGTDVQYTTTATAATLTFTFRDEVSNVRFSLYDLDASQRVTVSAASALSLPQVVTLSKANVASAITFTLNPGVSPRANGPATTTGSTSDLGTVNVDIPGDVKTVTINFSNAMGDVFLSDITACVDGAFPINYHQTAGVQPFVGQPNYFIVTPDNNSAYMLDPATGKAKLLFTEIGATYINSFAYDAVNRLLYYVTDGTATPSSNRQLKRYNFNTEASSIVTTNLITHPTLLLPLFSLGVESAAASFYDGCLYLGIEGGKQSGGTNTTRETIVWRIAFDGSLNPVSACQVMALPNYTNGTNTSIHDWGDFYVKDGIVYDFNTARTQLTPGPPPTYSYPNSSFIRFDMRAGTMVTTPNPNAALPYIGQAGYTWDGKMYSIRNVVEEISGAGVLTNSQPIVVTSGPAWVGNAGDASEPFKPKSDFGDAPASYDPNPNSPATHERDPLLRIGNNYVHEWNKTSSALANADTDEDGLGAAPPILNYNSAVTYSINVAVFNNTGANATLFGWLDYNFNGLFDATEAVSINVASNAALQVIPLTWNITVGNAPNTQTYLRLRLTSGANNMTAANSTGWFDNGEVEDYRVLRGADLLSNSFVSFAATKNNVNAVELKWTVQGFDNIESFEVLRSANNQEWKILKAVVKENNSAIQNLSMTDGSPLTGKSYYKVRVLLRDGNSFFTQVKSVQVTQLAHSFIVYPNPIKNTAFAEFNSGANEKATVRVYHSNGLLAQSFSTRVVAGHNKVALKDIQNLHPGVYTLKIDLTDQKLVSEIVISK